MRLKNYMRAAIKLSKEDLLLAYKDTDELSKLAKDELTSQNFSERLIKTIYGVGTLSTMALETKKILDKLGVSLNEFKIADDVKKLQIILNKRSDLFAG